MGGDAHCEGISSPTRVIERARSPSKSGPVSQTQASPLKHRSQIPRGRPATENVSQKPQSTESWDAGAIDSTIRTHSSTSPGMPENSGMVYSSSFPSDAKERGSVILAHSVVSELTSWNVGTQVASEATSATIREHTWAGDTMSRELRLSPKSREILEMIALGHSYSQIVDGCWNTLYPDIFLAAAEALQVCGTNASESGYEQRMVQIKSEHPRAYEKWTVADDCELKQLFHAGMSMKDLAARFQRQRSAIRSRIQKLGLQD